MRRILCSHANGSRRLWGWIIRSAAGAALVLALAAIPALAAKPKAGCWGYCGGPLTPSTPFFMVARNHVEFFGDDPACLRGTGIAISKKLPISRAGRFSFTGRARRSNASQAPVHVVLAGRFTAATKAKVTLTVGYKRCGTGHFTVQRIAP